MTTLPTADTGLPEAVDLDLDLAEKPEEERLPPFKVKIAGRVIVMQDPSDLDWQDLADIQDPTEFIRYAVSAEDKRHILNQNIEGWRFGRLMEGYLKHYRLDDKIDEAQRRARRSQRG